MSRLAYALIRENKKRQNQENYRTHLAKMPFEYYGYYSHSRFFCRLLLLNWKRKCTKTFNKLMGKYQENLV
jgi:hypothetical protein